MVLALNSSRATKYPTELLASRFLSLRRKFCLAFAVRTFVSYSDHCSGNSICQLCVSFSHDLPRVKMGFWICPRCCGILLSLITSAEGSAAMAERQTE